MTTRTYGFHPYTPGLTDLRAQFIDTDGANVGVAITTGFVEIGVDGDYMWTGEEPSDFSGVLNFYSNADSTHTLGNLVINPDADVTLADGAITAAKIATDAITAAKVAADAVTKIQSGLATPTNITGGTITTVTNLTNAPTNGDLTATMKASVNAEADTALADAGVTTTVTGRIDVAISTRLATAGYTAPDNATIATRASQTSVDTLSSYVDTEVAAIKAKTDNLPSDPADASDIAAAVAAIQSDTSDLQAQIGTAGVGLTALGDTRIGTINTNVASILGHTGTTGVVLSTATLQAIADALLKRGASHVDGATPEENSLYELIEAVLQSNTATGAWLIYRTDGTTLFNTRAITTDVDALPIVGAS